MTVVMQNRTAAGWWGVLLLLQEIVVCRGVSGVTVGFVLATLGAVALALTAARNPTIAIANTRAKPAQSFAILTTPLPNTVRGYCVSLFARGK